MRKNAFTLAELLMSVLVISIIMVALAPVITKRMSDNIAIEVNRKKGLEIFTNPGTYTFDVPVGINTLFIQGAGGGGGGGGANYIEKTTLFDSDATWTVPEGVNEVKFTIIGAGGGGGGGYGKTKSDSCEANSRRIPYAADNGQDLCVTNIAPINSTSHIRVVNINEECNLDGCCWQGLPDSSIHTTVCTRNASIRMCQNGKTHNPNSPFDTIRYDIPDEGQKYGRLITNTEINRLFNTDSLRSYLGSAGINLCYSSGGAYNEVNPYPSIIPDCTWQRTCPGAYSNNCMPDAFFSAEGGLYFYGTQHTPQISVNEKAAWAILCVRNLQTWESFSGAGGSSGAMIENKTIKVLPKDTLTIKIGKGGAGGAAGQNGGKGDFSSITHKRNNAQYQDPDNSVNSGYYYAYGGTGGLKATSAANGKPQETVNNGCSHSAECKNAVTEYGGKGCEGSTISGGKGAGGSAGGTIDTGENSVGTGYKGTNAGYGGGGGACPRFTHSPSGCKAGGSGADGRIILSYRIAIPGAGGGAGSNVGGKSSSNQPYEIKYSVSEGARIVFKIGAGGAGGSAAQDGLNGTTTVIGDNEIVFLAGQGGKTLSLTQKNNLSNCIGSTTSSAAISNCIANYKAFPGYGSYINQDGNIETNTLGLIIKNAGSVEHTVPNSTYTSQRGRPGGQNSSSIPWKYGFDGGVGGAPHGMLNSSNFNASITCGGGIQGNITIGDDYICTSGTNNGNDARAHDPVNNEFGGAGGGGGGIMDNSSTLGSGGSGASGYLRIRWDESENED